MRLAWTAEAHADRRAIYDYIEARNPTAAVALDRSFSKAARTLVQHPEMGRIGRVDNTRELVINRNYVLIYDLADGIVRILRVLHTARQWPPDNG